MDFGYNYGYNYTYDVPAGSDSSTEFLTVFLAVYVLILAAVLLVSLVGYVFHSIGLYTIGTRMGKEHAWLAFIPFARRYYQGELAGPIRLKNKKIQNPGIWNLILPIIFSAVCGVLLMLLIIGFTAGIIVSQTTGNAGVLGGTMFGLIIFYMALIVFSIAYSAVYMVLKIMINRQIYMRFTTDNMAIIHAVLSSAVPLYEGLCTFVMRNREFGADCAE